jgi:hypothetical protein
MKFDDIEYTATFVPQSRSRNAGEKTLSINWVVKIETKRGVIVTDYMQGIGHIPNYSMLGPRTVIVAEREKMAAEQGRYFPSKGSEWNSKPLPTPELSDVMSSLLLDSQVLDAADFEEWAIEFGYDTDSLAAEKIYKGCLEIALKMRRMFGDERLKEMREALNAD